MASSSNTSSASQKPAVGAHLVAASHDDLAFNIMRTPFTISARATKAAPTSMSLPELFTVKRPG